MNYKVCFVCTRYFVGGPNEDLCVDCANKRKDAEESTLEDRVAALEDKVDKMLNWLQGISSFSQGIRSSF